jgi:hypothetical protein
VGLASPAVRGEEDRELTFEVGDIMMGSGMATGVRDDDGGTAIGVEAEGGVSNGVGVMGSGMVRRGRGRGSGTTTGAVLAVSRLKAGSATGLARWRGVEVGSRCTKGGGIEGGGGAEGRKLGQPDGAN